jgi:hypothetical protein
LFREPPAIQVPAERGVMEIDESTAFSFATNFTRFDTSSASFWIDYEFWLDFKKTRVVTVSNENLRRIIYVPSY